MYCIDSLNFKNTYVTLPGEFYERVDPTPFKSPFSVAMNPHAAGLIDLDINCYREHITDYLSGRKALPGSQPLAMYYTGHQFGVYNKHIGDGRAILLGEVENSRGEKWDLHLKSAGRTRYSRQFDGRAVLRSVIREYLASEAMYGIGIPTTRALCIIGSEEFVQREKVEPAAMMVRLARSHVRFGNFEAFYYSGNSGNIKILADYLIDQNYRHLKERKDRYTDLIMEIAKSTAELIAGWQSVGFTHGVMNTDNMSVTGDTLDYGPFGFIEQFSNDYISNSSDHFGRYSYANQPGIGQWNLEKLTKCLSTLLADGVVSEIIEEYRSAYILAYLEQMAKKLGFKAFMNGDKKFIEQTLRLLENVKLDYTLFFRNLSDTDPYAAEPAGRFPKDAIRRSDELENWLVRYCERLRLEDSDNKERKKLMNSVNPLYILRNYLAENAIRKAQDEGDYSEIERLRVMLADPYSQQDGMDSYALESPSWARNLSISCSS